MAQYYIHGKNNEANGPFDDETVIQGIKKGQYTPETLISQAGSSSWKAISSFDVFSEYFVQQTQETAILTSLEPKKDARLLEIKSTSVRLACPFCGQKYEVDKENYANKTVSCNVCSRKFFLPVLPNEPAAPEKDNTPSIPIPEDIPEGPIRCPHCFRTFQQEYILYIAEHPQLTGDPIVGQYEQKRFAPTVFDAHGHPLDAMGVTCTNMACPHCHLRIPSPLVEIPSFYLSLVGAPSSGKSYYLTALTHTLRREMGTKYSYLFADVDPLMNQVIDSYSSTIFSSLTPDKVAVLPKTHLTGSDFSNHVLLNNIQTELPKPFAFELKRFQSADSFNVILYDNAGEHFQPGMDTILNPATQHLAHSHGLIFLFDPINDAQMRRICSREDPQFELIGKMSDQAALFTEMISRIRRHRNMTATEKCHIPLIIAVGKYDVWADSFCKDIRNISYAVNDEMELEASLDMNAIMDVSFALRELMEKCAAGIVSSAEAFFDDVTFVPVSNFGCMASKDESGAVGIVPDMVSPVWVEVPFLLLLEHLGHISGSWQDPDPQAERNFSTVRKDNFILFQHPVSGKRIRLPENYAGTNLTIDGKKYALPPKLNRQTQEKTAASAVKHDIWS